MYPKYPQVIWRDLQHQHIFNLAQKYLRQSKKDSVIYISLVSVSEELRGINLVEAGVSYFHEEKRKHNAMLIMQGNFPKMNGELEAFLGSDSIVDEVKYDDELLTINGQQPLRSLKKYGSIRFYIDM